jgi:hypothetical protein
MTTKNAATVLSERKKRQEELAEARAKKPEPHHFDYRLVVWTRPDGEEVWSLREMHYDRDDNVLGMTTEPVPLVAESFQGIRDELLLFMAAAVKPAYDGMTKKWLDPWGTDVTEAVT